jgi:glycosyltransferase involved in cell wall biosynthesis
MILSTIIPYHNTLELTKQLLDVLIPQLTDECELIIVDDDVNTFELDKYVCSNVKVIHHDKNSGCAGKPRNTGLDNSIGDYITFIDSDDLVSNNYIEKIINKIDNSEFDYCLFSWQYNGVLRDKIIITDKPPEWNYSVWNCIYKRKTMGNEKFNEEMKVGEDGDFNIRVRKGEKENIEDILYFYNDNREGSVTHEYIHNKG